MGAFITTPYDGGSLVPGTLTAGQICFQFAVPRQLTLPANAPNSQAVAKTAAAGNSTFSIQKNGVQVGTFLISSNGTTGAFTVAGDVSMVAGDLLSVVGPNPADANLANLSITLALQRR